MGAAAWLTSMRCRMSRFHSRRSICQMPSPSETTKIGSEMRVGHKAGLSRIMRPPLSVQRCRAMGVLLGDQPRLQHAQHPYGEPDGERPPDQDMHPPWRLEAELDPEDQDHDDGAEAQDDEHGGP